MICLNKGEEYKTVNSSKEILNKVKDSKFYGIAKNCASIKLAEKFINNIKEKHSDANHHVNAYRLYDDNNIIEYSDDDGEPAGSSGKPVLQQISTGELLNTAVVVTRYFGGTKLGIGGLIRADGETAKLAIEAAGIKKLILYKKIKFRGPYDKIGDVLGQLEKFKADIQEQGYEEGQFVIYAVIKYNIVNNLIKEIKEITSNKVRVIIEDYFYL
ncbi:MAG: YigZ family protein [Halarsenatibacteraceae bacterium]